MLAIPLLLAASTMGVDYGWQRTADGQWEYIVQVEPALLQNLAEGESIVSTMPAEMDGVRRVVLKVGTEALPRERMPEVRRMAGTSGLDAFGQGTNAPTTAAREIVDEWATRPRIDQIPFAERDRSRVGARSDGRAPLTAAPRSGLNSSRDRTASIRDNSNWSAARDRESELQHEWQPSRSAFGGSNSTASARSNVPFRQRTMPLPPVNETFPRSSSGSFDSTATNNGSNWNRSGIPRGSSRRAEYDDEELQDGRFARDSRELEYERDRRDGEYARDRRDSSTMRSDRNRQLDDRERYADTTRTSAPPKASISENRGIANASTPVSGTRASTPTGNSVTIISLFLFMSLGGNLYLGWLARDFYWRYRDIAWEIRNNQASSSQPAD